MAPKVEFLCSVMNFFDFCLPTTLFRGIGDLGQMAQEAGYDGFQWYPLRLPVAALQMNWGSLNSQEKDLIKGLHASWRGERNVFQALKHPHPLVALASCLLMPYKNDRRHLLRTQAKVGRKLPVCLYHDRDSTHINQHDFAEELVQPYPEMWRFFGGKDPIVLGHVVKNNGFTGLALNLTALRYLGESTLLPWEYSLRFLLPFSSEIQVSFWEVAPHLKLPWEFAQLIDRNPNEKEELVEMLRYLHALGWPEKVVVRGGVPETVRVVTKVPPRLIADLSGRKPLGEDDWLYYHHKLTANLRKFFGS